MLYVFVEKNLYQTCTKKQVWYKFCTSFFLRRHLLCGEAVRMIDITQGFVQRDFLFFSWANIWVTIIICILLSRLVSYSSSQSTDDTSLSNLSRSWMRFFSRNKNDFSEFCYVNLIITSWVRCYDVIKYAKTIQVYGW